MSLQNVQINSRKILLQRQHKAAKTAYKTPMQPQTFKYAMDNFPWRFFPWHFHDTGQFLDISRFPRQVVTVLAQQSLTNAVGKTSLLSPPSGMTTDSKPAYFLTSISVFWVFSSFSCSLRLCSQLSWLSVSFWAHINMLHHIVPETNFLPKTIFQISLLFSMKASKWKLQ